MNKSRLQQCWWVGLRMILGAVFIYAGAVKMAAPQEFADSIATFQILSVRAIAIVALWLPVLEMALGGMLLFGIRKRVAALGVLLLLAIFTLALGQALLRGLSVDCGCFGSEAPSVGRTWLSFGRDALLLASSAVLYRHALGKQQSNDPCIRKIGNDAA